MSRTRYQKPRVLGVEITGDAVWVNTWQLSRALVGNVVRGAYHTPPYGRERAHSLWGHIDQTKANSRVDRGLAEALGFTYCKQCEKGDRFPRVS